MIEADKFKFANLEKGREREKEREARKSELMKREKKF